MVPVSLAHTQKLPFQSFQARLCHLFSFITVPFGLGRASLLCSVPSQPTLFVELVCAQVRGTWKRNILVSQLANR